MKFVTMIIFVMLTAQENAFNESDIYGEWKWLYSKGGLMDHTLTPENTNMLKRIVLTKDHVAMFYAGDSLTLRKNYQIQSEKTIFSGSPQVVLRLVGLKKTQALTLTANDSLELKDNSFDGYTHRYVRVK